MCCTWSCARIDFADVLDSGIEDSSEQLHLLAINGERQALE